MKQKTIHFQMTGKISFLISSYFNLFPYFRIALYATTHTEDSVYIIGGTTRSGSVNGSSSKISTIAKYKDNMWTIAGNLKQARRAHGAITVEGKTMIIGGEPQSGPTPK